MPMFIVHDHLGLIMLWGVHYLSAGWGEAVEEEDEEVVEEEEEVVEQ